ncbi:uncharacterized protein TRUGW13939_07833 [Talaromyces rugulosus]|uniref:Core domain-containing protein n=1 Tax=Talaromyces rugulosus TaxID=121627 RepID=A0A7H8R347_TALRU|nr:uncharacterized protein TRUGW13939_07833 [Talaromyces rugulosus]QKX60687.1 hypothetical protein TRUGW13939_07833 [Talaromyces rugulosus]
MSQPKISLWVSRAARKQSLAGTLHAQPCQHRRLHTSHFGTPIVANPRSQQYALPTLRQSTTNISRSRTTMPQNPWRSKQRLAFTTTAQKKATAVLTNPRVDDDGNPLLIEISQRAAKRLRDITDPTSTSVSTTLKENPYNHLRITVTSGGCHGFQYLMTLESTSKIDAEEDTIFEAEQPTDSSETKKGEAKVVMDGPSLELLSGSTVDFTTELIGSQFKIVDNPRATSNCGCGTSFDVKD